MSKLVTGFHHVAITCKDYDRSVAFYKAIGLEQTLSWGEGDTRAAMMTAGDSVSVELFAGLKNEVPAGKWAHLAFASPDCDAAYAAALAAGATVQMEPKDVDIPAHSGPYPVRIAFVYGPDGESVEFFQVKKV